MKRLSMCAARFIDWFSARRTVARRRVVCLAVAQLLRSRLKQSQAQLEQAASEIEDLQSQLDRVDHRNSKLQAELDVARTQIDLMADWQSHWQARMQAEAAIQVTRKANALNGNKPIEE